MDADKARAILQNVLNGVSIVTTKKDEIINGMTVAWVSQITWEPPMIMVSIGTGKYTTELISSSKVFAVNVLNEHQIDLAKHFGLKSGRDGNKFEEIPYEAKITGSPILKDIVAYLDCKLHTSNPLNTRRGVSYGL
jgi:flavin reductase (DIM6/NTAB) family NADH-FMN oxidoreductase RutF